MSKAEIYENATNQLVELKDTSELMIDLAYSALLLNSNYLAQEVQQLKERVDQLNLDFEYLLLSCQMQEEDVKGLIGLIRIGLTAENIADAASEIAQVVLRGIEPHPVLRMMIDEADETVLRVTVPPDSPLVGKTLKEAQIPEETGVWVLSIKRGDKWIKPKAGTLLALNDQLIASGYADGEEDFKQLVCGCSNPQD